MADLFDSLCSPASLLKAWQRVRGKNSAGGIDGLNPPDLDKPIAGLLAELSGRLMQDHYVPEPYREFMIPKHNPANEWRTLSLPAVIDKVVQQAVVDAIGPSLEKQFVDSSYAYRPGKGPVKACRRVDHILRSAKPGWVAACDIDDFFPSLPHDRLLKRLGREVDDQRLLKLVGLWLRAGYVDGRGGFSDPQRGIAQGAVISPLLANLYLHDLDLLAREKTIDYIRYSDNFLVLAADAGAAEASRQLLEDFLDQPLGLRLNREGREPLAVAEGFAFLGIFFGPRGKSISRAKERKMVRRINYLTEPQANPDPIAARRLLNRKIAGHRNFYGYIEPHEEFARLDSHLCKRLVPLLAAYRRRGVLGGRNELEAYCREFDFYLERPKTEQQALISGLLDEVFHPSPAPEAVGGDRALSHRLQARQSHYVRELSGASEVVVASPGIFIGKSRNRLILKQQRKIIAEMPFSRLSCVTVVSAGVSLSSDVIRYCAAKNIPLNFYGYTGRAYASLRSPLFSSGDLTLFQVRMYANGRGLTLSRKIIIAKCRSQMNLLKYYNRHRSTADPVFNERLQPVLAGMSRDLSAMQALNIKPPLKKCRNEVFTAEARVAAGYWQMIGQLLPRELGFGRRVKKGAQDVVNVMLNYGYGILYQRVWEALHRVGLNPEVGFLHAWHRGRPTLVYDLVEEYRQIMVDRPLFSLMTKGNSYRSLGLRQGSNLLDDKTRDLVLETVIGRFSSLVNFRNRKVRGEDIIFLQAADLAAYISGEKKNYRPFIMTY